MCSRKLVEAWSGPREKDSGWSKFKTLFVKLIGILEGFGTLAFFCGIEYDTMCGTTSSSLKA